MLFTVSGIIIVSGSVPLKELAAKWVDDKCYKMEKIKIGENYNIEFSNFFVNKIDVI